MKKVRPVLDRMFVNETVMLLINIVLLLLSQAFILCFYDFSRQKDTKRPQKDSNFNLIKFMYFYQILQQFSRGQKKFIYHVGGVGFFLIYHALLPRTSRRSFTELCQSPSLILESIKFNNNNDVLQIL